MNISKQSDVNATNVYNACNADYREDLRVNKEYISENPTSHKLVPFRNGLQVHIDKDARDMDQVIKQEGRIISPDELLEMQKPGQLKIPLMDLKETDDTEDIGETKCQKLPSSDLLKALHYYVASKYTKNIDAKNPDRLRYVESMDETSLLAMGLLIENWVDELVTEDVCRMYLQKVDEEKSFVNQMHEDLEMASADEAG